MRIFLIGFMGSGKTHWGRRLSKKLQIPFFDLDETIVEQEQRSINDIFNIEGEERFRIIEKEVLTIITESHDTFIMATGGGTPCFNKNIDYMNASGITVWINPTREVLFERLANGREHRPLLKTLDDESLRNYINKKLGDRSIYYRQAKIIIDEEVVTPELLIEKLHLKNNPGTIIPNI